jgi:hypothetical protein
MTTRSAECSLSATSTDDYEPFKKLLVTSG